ncbi:MAG: glycosyltransferase family 9 protein [Bdellovibrionales bacterium]|nr:glycosyltransferase family 9 protein [Bdellovibrionales bacterium]
MVLRLSSLGDVILSTSGLQSLPAGETVDWVTSREFQDLLTGHPRIERVWPFDRRGGIRGWLELLQGLWAESYTEVVDLHGSLRTRLARWVFLAWSLRDGRPAPRWTRINKGRLRRWGQYWFKRFFPKKWLPTPWVRVFSRALAGTPEGHPDLSHLVAEGAAQFRGSGLTLPSSPYLCVMPATRWPAKEWPPERFAAWLSGRAEAVVVLGTASDAGSLRLAELLAQEGRPHLNAVGRLKLPQTAAVLAGARAFVGGDTGLAHLAEAVGAPAWVLYGPTVPAMGFGPWRGESRAAGMDLWCRPCGKDGRFCYRPLRRYLCMKELTPETVEGAIGATPPPGGGA